MVGRRRKRRNRRGYVRPSRAKPKTGWTLRQLSSLCGVSPRTLHLYLQRGVLPRPPFKGSATRYQRRELLWLLAIRRLRETERLPLDAIRKRVQALPEPELEAFATARLLPGPLAVALGLSAPALQAVSTPSGSGSPLDGSGPLSASPRWVRLELALGLELHLREDASARVLELARRIRDLGAADVTEAR